jgi:hypothetical protein
MRLPYVIHYSITSAVAIDKISSYFSFLLYNFFQSFVLPLFYSFFLETTNSMQQSPSEGERVKKLPAFYEHKGSLHFSLQPATGPYHEPDKSNP